jgi:hypothetical protein
MNVETVMQQARELSAGDRRRLIRLLVESLVDEPPAETGDRHDIMEFAGVGADLWRGTDAQDYIHKLRAEWDETE